MDIEEVEYGTSGDKELELAMLAVFQRAFRLWCERHRKYGRGNIAEFGEVGCMVRAADKLARLKNHYIGNAQYLDFQDETLTDTWLDMVNYAAMGLLCSQGKWPGALKLGPTKAHE